MGTLILCDFCILDVKKLLKLLALAFRPRSNMSNISFAVDMFPIKIGRNAQWEHLFSMYFDDFIDHLPYFLF